MKNLVLISEDKNFRERFKEHMEFGEEFKVYDLFYDQKDKLQEFTFSVLVIDISRENFKEGIKLLGFLKTLKDFRTVPVVVISDYSDPDFLYRILKEGANDFIEKTEDFNLIKKKIKKIFE